MLGVETPGLYESPTPRRRSDSSWATEATAIAEAAAAACSSNGLRQHENDTVNGDRQHENDIVNGDRQHENGAASSRERDNLLQIGGAAR